jgi:hypothetical protein
MSRFEVNENDDRVYFKMCSHPSSQNTRCSEGTDTALLPAASRQEFLHIFIVMHRRDDLT